MKIFYIPFIIIFLFIFSNAFSNTITSDTIPDKTFRISLGAGIHINNVDILDAPFRRTNFLYSVEVMPQLSRKTKLFLSARFDAHRHYYEDSTIVVVSFLPYYGINTKDEKFYSLIGFGPAFHAEDINKSYFSLMLSVRFEYEIFKPIAIGSDFRIPIIFLESKGPGQLFLNLNLTLKL